MSEEDLEAVRAMYERRERGDLERTRSAAETEALGERLAAELGPGDVVLVSGELGAGKTTLIRGAARALGVREPVTSPTFTIGHTYSGRLPVSHLDLYRLAELDQEDPALLEDYLTPESVAFIEWPAAAEPWLDRVTRRVEIRHAGGDERDIDL
jgi:tRNA threonylcarbamoyladenosine biosynthesis protein TsaE